MRGRQRLAVAALGALAALAVAIPLALVALQGAAGGGAHLGLLKEILQSPYYRRVISFTFLQALASSAITIAAGLPGAYIFSTYEFRGKRQLMALSSVPFVLPSVLVVLGFVIFFGNTGTLNTILGSIPGIGDTPLRVLYSWKAIVLAHAFYNIPLVYRIVSSVWGGIDERMLEASYNMGASRLRAFLDIELPHLRHAILSAALLTFIYSFTSFAVVLALGGPQYATVEVTIYTLAQYGGKLGTASMLALVQLAALGVVVWAYARIPPFPGGAGRKKMRELRLSSGKAKALIAAYAAAVAAFLYGPLAGICYESVRSGTGFTLDWFRAIATGTAGYIGTSPRGAVLLSLAIGACATALAVSAAVVAAYSLRAHRSGGGVLNVATMLPLCISTLTMALGYVILGNRTGLDIRFAGIVIIHAMIGFPFAVRSVHAGVEKIDRTLVEAAMNLGASRLRAFATVDLPLIKSSIVSASVFAFAISLGELAATYMIGGGAYATIPVYIYRYIGGYRIGPAAAMGVVLMAVSAASFFIIDRMGPDAEL